MFFSTAEVLTKSFFKTNKERRVIAFDCAHRILYISKKVDGNGAINADTPVVWKSKVKVSSINCLVKNDFCSNEDILKVEVLGKEHALRKDSPHLPIMSDAASLLCPASSVSVPLSRFTASNEDFVKDPFFLYELHESLKQLLTRVAREREAREGVTTTSSLQLRTSSLPEQEEERAEGGSSGKKAEGGDDLTVHLLDLRDEYQFRRFVYLVESVLGYDGLAPRPHGGYPPYDPRNLISFGYLPLKLHNKFQPLEKNVFYIFTSGTSIDCTAKGAISIASNESLLCLTHDWVLVYSVGGRLQRWLPLSHVQTFNYNYHCGKPYMVFLSDQRTNESQNDLIFLPARIASSPSGFDDTTEVQRVKLIMEGMGSGLVMVRRVVEIKEAVQESLQAFVSAYQRAHPGESVLSRKPSDSPPNIEETLREAWRAYRRARSEAVDTEGVPAVPLRIEGDPSQIPLTQRQMAEIQEQLVHLGGEEDKTDEMESPYPEGAPYLPRPPNLL